MESHGKRKGRAEYRFPAGMDFWERYRERLLSDIDAGELLEDVRQGRPGGCRLHADGCMYEMRPLATGGIEAVRYDGDGREEMSALLMALDDGSLNVYTSVMDAPGAADWSMGAVKRLVCDIYVLNRACRELAPLVEDTAEES